MVSAAEGAREIEVQVPINIALIKYWGKRDTKAGEELILPLNDSVSLSIDDVFARTRLRIGDATEQDSVEINGQPVDLGKSKRFGRCFAEVRRVLRKRAADADAPEKHSFHVSSVTNFPVGAGLASSAAGFAAIAAALGEAFGLQAKQISRAARIGSGSACRSVLGGLVRWRAGDSDTGADCYSESVFPSTHWPELRALIVVLEEAEKEVGSTVGMQTTVRTSRLLEHRVKEVVPERVEGLMSAFSSRDFPSLARITMQDSNQFHACCQDTFPPLRYMSDASWRVISVVNALNGESEEGEKYAYTFDAGANACVFTTKEEVPALITSLLSRFRCSPEVLARLSTACEGEFSDQLSSLSAASDDGPDIKNLILSRVGGGPRVLSKQ